VYKKRNLLIKSGPRSVDRKTKFTRPDPDEGCTALTVYSGFKSSAFVVVKQKITLVENESVGTNLTAPVLSPCLLRCFPCCSAMRRIDLHMWHTTVDCEASPIIIYIFGVADPEPGSGIRYPGSGLRFF
jgi:hypothetical protein